VSQPSGTSVPRIESADPHVLDAVADALEFGCVITDCALVVCAWNRWMEAATGLTSNDVLGRPLASIFPNFADTAAARAFERAAGGEAVIFSHRFHEYLLPLQPPSGSGDFAYMQQSARVLPLVQDGATTGAIALIQDVTERVAREQELDRAKQAAELANQTKSEFLTAMSHEFRTPLNAILGYAAILDTEISGPLNPGQKDHLHRIEAGTRHLVALIEEILTFASLEAQKLEPVYSEVDARAVAAEVISLLENQAREKAIDLRTDLGTEPIVLTTDEHRLRQIMVNVVGNAIKFTDAGLVAVQLRAESDTVVFEIADTGRGIPADHVQHIFEPFVRVQDFSAGRKSGTGLGLPLSRSLAQLIGGSLKLQKTGPEGSTFVLTIPRR
jgi:PAS domain S-box-containing protein